MPVFDELRGIFIFTEGVESFYVDIDGNYDRNLGHQIVWSAPPIHVAIVRPYLIGFLENQQIEIKHLISPQIVTQGIELLSTSFCFPIAIARQSNMTMRLLDQIYVMLVGETANQRILVKLSQH